MNYTLDEHQHKFAAWYAARTTSFNGENAKILFEASTFNPDFNSPDMLPSKVKVNATYQRWQKLLIKQAEHLNIKMTPQRAEKLIGGYLKSRFIFGPHCNHPKTKLFYPILDIPTEKDPFNQLQHELASLCGAKAASIRGPSSFENQIGISILEASGFVANFNTPELLPSQNNMDKTHKIWREKAIKAAATHGVKFTHGVAAKLINVYMKSRFVCGPYCNDEKVKYIHPPVDRVLLTALAKNNIGGYKRKWSQLKTKAWSKFNSADYQEAIDLIKSSMNKQPLWKIEEHWQGHQ